jgi:hypothetical protein
VECIALGFAAELIARGEDEGGPHPRIDTPELMGIGGGGTPAKLYREIHGILFVIILLDMFVLNGYDVIQ